MNTQLNLQAQKISELQKDVETITKQYQNYKET